MQTSKISARLQEVAARESARDAARKEMTQQVRVVDRRPSEVTL
jgi:hypothetical protein